MYISDTSQTFEIFYFMDWLAFGYIIYYWILEFGRLKERN